MANLNLNKVILCGRLTADVELKQTPSGVAVCSFNLAVNRKYQKEGEGQAADFISCVAWRQRAEFIAKYFKKGSSLCITGELQTRQYTDKNGAKRNATEVMVEDAFFVDGKGEGSKAPAEPAAPEYTAAAEEFMIIKDEDDLPF
jgi:single-strand DNA-binding protein